MLVKDTEINKQKLNKYQTNSDEYHPLTCKNGCGILEVKSSSVLKAISYLYLLCPVCSYVQVQIPEAVCKMAKITNK